MDSTPNTARVNPWLFVQLTASIGSESRLVFPDVESPIAHKMSLSKPPPVFDVEHLDKRNDKGYWRSIVAEDKATTSAHVSSSASCPNLGPF
jgi:hypothetical protein